MGTTRLVYPCAHRRLSWFAGLILIGAVASARGAETTPRPKPRKAPRLVQAALDAGVSGDFARRDALLAEAIAADPEFAPARWQTGRIKFDGDWRTPEQVQNLVAYHHRWTEYRKLRDSVGNAPVNHEQLAVWCRDHGLANEERFHWANVLASNPFHKTARQRLSLRIHRGGLFTHSQVAEFERQQRDSEANLERFLPKFTKLCREAAMGTGRPQATALAELGAVVDSAAVEALETAISRQSAKSPRASLQLNLALVAALARMPQHAATVRLLDLAGLSKHDEVRTLAAMALKKRPATDYVPQLMAALKAPIELDVDVLASPDGTVRLTETFYQNGAEEESEHVRSVNFETDGVLRYDPSRNNPGEVLQRHGSRAAAIASETQRRVEAANAENEARNERIVAILRIVFELDSQNVEQWWGAWQEANDLNFTKVAAEKTVEEFTQVYEYAQSSPMYASEGAGSGAGTPATEGRRASSFINMGLAPPSGLAGCFKAGTPVWTQSGPVAIERIELGDLVLCQHPQTGEVAYRPVLRTTFGSPTDVVQIDAGSDSINATLGHRFWVDGRGWEMAKFLQGGDRLHAFGGAFEISKIVPVERDRCYNLIVDEFHTYFVGKGKILVHDIGCPAPVVVATPGSATLRAPWAPRSAPPGLENASLSPGI